MDRNQNASELQGDDASVDFLFETLQSMEQALALVEATFEKHRHDCRRDDRDWSSAIRAPAAASECRWRCRALVEESETPACRSAADTSFHGAASIAASSSL